MTSPLRSIHTRTKDTMRRTTLLVLPLATLLAAAPAHGQGAAGDHDPAAAALIANALRAAPVSITDHAAVADWEGNMLREGTNGWVCLPDPPRMKDAPMCMDGPWMAWAGAWQKNEPVSIDRAGIAYMLVGDAGASNVDPYAEGPTTENEWVVSGPHLMLIVPDAAALEGFPTDPAQGGPWVMWKGTPYAHVMIPVAQHP